MIYKDVEFHNIEEITPWDSTGAILLGRYPKAVREAINPRGRWNGQILTGSEIRFVTDGPMVRVHLTNLDFAGVPAYIFIFKGDFFVSCRTMEAGVITSLHLEGPPRFEKVHPEALKGRCFSNAVWRLFLSGCLPVLHQIDTLGKSIRPPHASEKPSLTWLAYGSSITAGAGVTTPLNTYVQQAAWRLGVDVLNLGLGGSCMCEPQLADYLANRNDWDFATLELGVNMCGLFSIDEFRQRVLYLIQTLQRRHPQKVLVLITSFPFAEDRGVAKEISQAGTTQEEYNKYLREIVSRDTTGCLRLVEGHKLLPEFSELTCDLGHPSDYGHIRIGENLARALSDMGIVNGNPT